MIFITIAIIFFLIGTGVSVWKNKPIIVLTFFTFGYIFLIIGSYTYLPNFILLWICLMLNLIGLIKVVKKNYESVDKRFNKKS